MKIRLMNSAGVIREVKLGFSWTMLFFGPLVPLFRGDLKWMILSLVLDVLTSGIAWLILPFTYNKSYIKGLLYAGWIPADRMSEIAMITKGLPVPHR